MTDAESLFGQEVRVECCMLCDGAQEANGKLYVLGGGWDAIMGPTFPMGQPPMALAIRLAVPWNLANRPMQFRIEVRDEDERDILPRPLDGTINVGRPPNAEAGDDLAVLMAITLSGVTFPRPGGYTFTLLIDGRERARTKLRARQAKRP